MTSIAPGSGTSISSIWKASCGSPKRSSRMTQAAIVAGSSPGSTASCATWLVSTDIWPQPTRPLEPVAALHPEERGQGPEREHQAADAEDQEVGPGVDVA